MTDALKQFILSHRREDGFIEGRLSSSAVSTAVACVALDLFGGNGGGYFLVHLLRRARRAARRYARYGHSVYFRREKD